MAASDILTWIGTFFSIAGAAVAIWQARQSATAAVQAKKMRDDIVGRNTQSELSDLGGGLKAALRALDKYGPGVGSDVRRGSSPESDAATVRALTAELALKREMLANRIGPKCEEVRVSLNALLAEFANAADDDQRRPFGLDIYNELSAFSGTLKSALDSGVFGDERLGPRIRPI
jgi:hypothetical protein